MTAPLPRWYRRRNSMSKWERPFWDDHRRDMEDPEYAAAFLDESRRTNAAGEDT